jgi:hypothetical protein
MNAYEEKQQARVERYEALAEKHRAAADAACNRAHEMASIIPFGQPILVGHHSEGRDRIMDLKLRGWTDSQIAEETGCDRSTITRIVIANEIGGDHWREARRVVVPALRRRGRTVREICEIVPCGVRAVEAALSPDDDEGREECRQILAENLRRVNYPALKDGACNCTLTSALHLAG